MKKIIIINITLILILPALLMSQYSGGNGRGDVMVELLSSPLTNAGNYCNTVPSSYSLQQNYPNPFNPVTKISFNLPKSGLVTIRIFDILGNEVKTLVNEVRTIGTYTYDFDGTDISGGLYFCKMESCNFKKIIKMILLK